MISSVGFAERLEKELCALVPSSVLIQVPVCCCSSVFALLMSVLLRSTLALIDNMLHILVLL